MNEDEKVNGDLNLYAALIKHTTEKGRYYKNRIGSG